MEQNQYLMIILNSIVIIYAIILFIYGKYFRKKDYLFFQNFLYIDTNKDLLRSVSYIDGNQKLLPNQRISKMDNLIEEN